MNNILKAMDEIVTVYDSFCEEIGGSIPLALLDTKSWKVIGQGYIYDATLILGSGILLDFERALENGSPAFTLAHEFAHIEQHLVGSLLDMQNPEPDADKRAVRILEEAGFEVKRSVSR